MLKLKPVRQITSLHALVARSEASSRSRTRPAMLLSPPRRELMACTQVAVGAPLLIDVLATAHQLLVRSKEHRVVLLGATPREMDHDRLPIRRTRRQSPTVRAERSKDAQDVVRTPGHEAASLQLDLVPIRNDAQPGGADDFSGRASPDASRAVQLVEQPGEPLKPDAALRRQILHPDRL